MGGFVPLVVFLLSVVAKVSSRQDVLGFSSTKRPNIVIILSDDQDLHMNSLSYMPLLQKHLIDQGTSYNRHFCTIALCCPSRVNLWTGKAAHNTNVTDVNPPYGTLLVHPGFEGTADRTISDQEVIQNSYLRDSTTLTFPCGCRKQATILTTLASCSMLILLRTGTLHFQQDSMVPISC